MKNKLLEKIRKAHIIESHFPLVVIDDFLPQDDFNLISDQLHIDGFKSDSDLINEALSRQFIPQDFPGCTNSVR